MSKRLLILRGLPGSGKSTFARGHGGTVLSSDDYFMVGGLYRFDAARLGLAHEWNQDRCRKAMEAEDPLVIIDNTNTRLWEMEPYKSLAKRHGYEVLTYTIAGPDVWNPAVLSVRNVHGVPVEVIERMMARFEHEA